MKVSARTRRFALPSALALMVGVALVLAGPRFFGERSGRLLLAPMIGLDTCLSPPAAGGPFGLTDPQLAQSCSGPQGSAAALVESTLRELDAGSRSPDFELGYTLNVPLLKLFKKQGDDWVIDRELLGRVVRTVRDADRPAILYLFSTHFGQDAPIEAALAADPANLSWTPQGPLPEGSFYGSPIYNWSLATTRNAITNRRVQAAQAVLQEICKLEPRHVDKIRGITLLGELHQLFPGYDAGMGFVPPYRVSDYSEVSQAGFRRFLEVHFRTIANLNAATGAHWTSFAQVQPPSKDLHTTPLRDFTEHIDSFAHGFLPVSGWAFVRAATDMAPAMIRIYRNGDLIARVPANLDRQDVQSAVPEVGNANTGWRYDLDFRKLPAGLHRIDVFLESRPNDLVHLATRNVAILDRTQQHPGLLPQKALPASRPAGASVRANVDMPADQSTYLYNPLVESWHAYRASQVANYLQSFNRVLQPPCLAKTKRYTHQVLPFTHPSWDETKFAVEASLGRLDGIGLGVSLYGEPVYGASFRDWLARSPHKHYGITEFHPLKAMDAKEFETVLKRNSGQGAEFVSFFLEPRWNGRLVARAHNVLSVDPDNRNFGSAQLYRSVQQLMQRTADAGPQLSPARAQSRTGP